MKQIINLTNLRENVFFFGLLLFVALLPFSEAFVSIISGFLLLQALVLFSWKHYSIPHGSWKNLLLITSVFFVYLLGVIFTKDLHFAAYELKKIVFWIVIPVALFISPSLSRKKFLFLMFFFCFSVFIASLAGIIKLQFSEYYHVTDFRKIILISHIRFSFQIGLAIIILTWMLISKAKIPFIGCKPWILILLLAWMIYFLVLLKSITGIIAFSVTLLVFILFLIAHVNNQKIKIFLFFAFIVLLFTPILYVSRIWYDFYNSEQLDPQTVEKLTPSGNPYSFDFSSKERENGHWVNAFLCETELRKEWNKMSFCQYDSLDKQGYPYSATLIRYLTSKGLKKDSMGVCQLTHKDIRAIENGFANHIYIDRTFSLYPRIYQTIWELDVYFRVGDPNFQSVSQRIEFVRASLVLIKKNPWLGIGTGNWKICYGEAYRQMNSKLYPENQGPSHNQYLNYLVKFGLFGFLFIFSAILVPVFTEGHKKNLFFWLFLVFMAIANFGDANLETHMGLSFFCFFYALFLWHSPQDLRNFKLLPGRFYTRSSGS
jgi:hypothetical protein